MTDAPRLHVEARGEGPPLLLLHGFAGSARNFRPQQRTLASRHRVIAYDARGHARSEAPDDPERYDARALVADALAVLEAEGAERAVVGGLSMGAAVALALARLHPERVQALVLASYPPGRRAERGTSRHAEAFAAALEAEGVEAAGERFVWGPGSGSTLDARGAALVRQGFLEHTAHGLAHTLRGFLAGLPSVEEIAPALAEVRVPALVVVGALDAESLEPCRSLAEALPDARLEVIPDAGHVVNLAQPAAFDAALLRFLESL